MVFNRILVLLVWSRLDIAKITPKVESNVRMAIGRYRGICDDIIVAVNKDLYQETMIELDGVVDSSKMVVVDNYYCDAHAMVQVAKKMKKTAGMSTKTAVCVKPMLLDMGMAQYASGDIFNYIETATKVVEEHNGVVMATANDDLVCRKTLYVAGINIVDVWVPDGNFDYLTINTAEADIHQCDAGIYFWRPSTYLDAIARVKKAKMPYDTMAKLTFSLADLGTPVLAPCSLGDWRPIIEWYWPAPSFL